MSVESPLTLSSSKGHPELVEGCVRLFRRRGAWALRVSMFTVLAVYPFPAKAIPDYFGLIPNGSVLQSNCGTCHDENTFPARNAFGADFGANGWSPTVAQGDQDGDGRLSGQELGDPSGTWIPGDADPPCIPP